MTRPGTRFRGSSVRSFRSFRSSRGSGRVDLAVWLAALLLTAAPLAAGTITVTTTADSGAGSLREAIATANSDGVPTTITFAGGLAGSTISPLSQLPDLTEDNTTIDGDFGADCDPDIQIDGSAAGPGADGSAFTSNGHTIRGLAFFDFDGDGLHVGGSNNVVECSYFGTNLVLASGHGNGERGINHVSGNDNRIGPGNVVAHNGGVGIRLSESGSDGYPLFTSLTPDDSRRYPFRAGFPHEDAFLFPDGCVWKSADGAVLIDGSGAPFDQNFGVRLTGQVDLGAGGDYTFGTLPYDFRRLLVDGSVVIDSTGPEPYSAVVSGLSSGAHTIELDARKDGGAAAITLTITGPGSVALSTGSTPPSGCGASLPGLCGELFRLRIPSERNTITQSSIYDNGGWVSAIALSWLCNPLENDAGDLDLGPNTLLNHPEITGVVYGGTPGSYTVSGTAPPDSTVELFRSYGGPGGWGQGVTYLTSFTANGVGAFAGAASLDAGDLLAATATDPAGNTSEFGPTFATNSGMDEATVGTNSGLPGATFEIPISVRDLSLTVLGRDRPAGERIQSLSFKVVYSPTGSFSSITAARAGITAALSPAFQSTPSTSNSISYIGQFNETTNLIPFTLDAAAPGDQVAKLTVTLAPSAPAGTISLTLETVATSLGNFAGTLEETTANGRLSLTNGSITVLSNAAPGLFAAAESSSTIRLRWGDPNANETGFRLERSTDGSSWASVTSSIGPNATSYLDTGRAPATLYYYRLVTLVPGDSTVSNRGFATTFPASAAKVCVQRLPGNDATGAVAPSAAWNDIDQEWAVVWMGREDGVQDEIWFQRLDSATLAPIGDPVNVSQSQMVSQYPTLVWNGSRYLVVWYEHMRREPGLLPLGIGQFAELEPDGTIVRRGVTPAISSLTSWLQDDLETPLAWDGTHWGLLTSEVPATHPFADVFYRRLDESGEVVLGPTALTATAGHRERSPDLAFNPALGVHGVAWMRHLDSVSEPRFQRLEESTGATLGSAQSLGSPFGESYGLSILANGADGWAVAWTEVASSPSEYATYFRKVDASGAPLGDAKIRLSDAAPTLDLLPSLHHRPDGGFVVFSTGYGPSGYAYEIVRTEADSAGERDGPVVMISSDDGVYSYLPSVAEDGERFLVVWSEFDTSGGQGHEIAGALVDADGLSAPEPAVDLTSGHTPSGGWFFAQPAAVGVAPLGAGFVALWTDPVHPGEIRGRSWDGSGATVQDFLPLNAAPLAGTVAMVEVGDSFAVVWRTAPNDYRFARYDANGLIAGESGISSASGNGALSLGFDGTNYVVLIRAGSSFLLRRIDPDGNPVGGEISVPASSGQRQRMIWTGGGWAVFWRGPGSNPGVNYMLISSEGGVLTPVTTVAPRTPPFTISQFSMAWNGSELGFAWAERKDLLDPPHQEVYFTRLGLDGSKAFPETTVVSSAYGDGVSQLYWAGGAFRLVHRRADQSGAREIAIDPADGSVLPGERFWSNRDGGAFAWNGVTLGMLSNQGNNRAAHFQTGACLDDPSPPPCPELSVASVGGLPRLTWPAVADPQSGIWRYQVIRDGSHMAELSSATSSWDDAGYRIGTTHAYQLLAMNGAYNESDGCAAVPYSTTAGDANGNGSFEIADLFYLINLFHGDGAPPGGDADANGDGGVTGGDLFYLINHFFSGGPPPV